MHLSSSFARIVPAAVLLVALTAPAVGQDPVAPCNEVAAYLQDYANANPDKATSEAAFPWPALAAAEAAPIGFVAETYPASQAELEAALQPLLLNAAAVDFLRSVNIDPSAGAVLIDARTLGDRLAIYQYGGSLGCYNPAIFDTREGFLRPAFTGGFVEGDTLCDGFDTSFHLLRIGRDAYPAILHLPDNESARTLEILPLSGANIETGAGQCRIFVGFARTENYIEWNLVKDDKNRQLAARVQDILLSVDWSEDLSAELGKYLAHPHQAPARDIFQRLAWRNESVSQPADLLTNDEEQTLIGELVRGGDWAIEGKYVALELDGEELIVARGTRRMGWREADFPSVEVWKRTEAGWFSLLTAEYRARSFEPEISVDVQQ